MKKFLAFIVTSFLLQNSFALPKNFVYLSDVDPTILQDIKYQSSDNFLGRPVAGYQFAKCILTRKTAEELSRVQKKLLSQYKTLVVYDCYRPTDAVSDFVNWSKVISDQKQKKEFYPNVNKADFFKLGYVADHSGHSRGSTVDLSIISLKTNTALNMGTHFDFMDPSSHPFDGSIKGVAKQNRLLLRTTMLQNGFVPYEYEWWHFTLKNEAYPNTYFNFPVE